MDCHFVQMFGLPVPAFLEKPILVEIRFLKVLMAKVQCELNWVINRQSKHM